MTELSKRERVLELLRTYRELWGPSPASLGDGSGVSMTPPEYRNGSYRELERVLALMRDQRPKQFAHVQGYYITSQEAIKVVTSSRKLKSGKREKLHTPTKVLVPARWVRLQVVEDGVTWIAQTMRHANLPQVTEPKRLAA